MATLEKLDEVIAGLSELRNGIAEHADLTAKLAKEKSDLLTAKTIAGGLAAKINERKAILAEIEEKITAANTELKEIEKQRDNAKTECQMFKSELNGMRSRIFGDLPAQ